MSDQNTNAEPSDAEAGDILNRLGQDPEGGEPDPAEGEENDDHDKTQDKGKGNREAAKYRTQLREVEAERDALNEQLTATRKQVINTAIERTNAGVKPELVWELGTDPADLLNKDGSVDTEKVRTTVGSISKRFGLTGSPDPLQAATINPTPEPKPKAKMFDNKKIW